ncbi:MAG TPA: DUF4331 domain-containing protein [Steroidobacteraceae bacterium]|nr:DUF4331 domain-containing protein [Steroidobacteraceae bacterium]
MKANLPSRLGLLAAAMFPLYALASSHREAPAIAGQPRVDGTDFYMFRSYEPGRSAYVTLIANYIPLQDAYGGPNYFNLDPKAVYRIHVDNDGDGVDDLRFDFVFTNSYKNLAVTAGGEKIPVPLINIGPVDAAGTNLNVIQSYSITLTRNGRREAVGNATLGGSKFYKPTDNIGNKSIADYAGYAAHFIYDVSIPDCSLPGRVFVGQRKDGFVVNLGEVFDLVNTNPAGPRDGEPNTLADKNVTSIALEVPIACLAHGKDPVIGAWTTASLPLNDGDQAGDDSHQVSRLGMPLVNELVIGLPDKDNFNASAPIHDAQFLKYVTNPSLPVILNSLFGNAATIPGTPRNDLVAAFLTGVKGINQPIKVTPSEMLRLNTSTPPTAPASQNDLGVLGGDLAGFPNGRRPYDDVVDITLRVAEGALCGAIGNCGTETSDPNHGIPYTDGARAAGPDAAHEHLTGAINAADTYLTAFPYLLTPIPGSPNGVNGEPK